MRPHLGPKKQAEGLAHARLLLRSSLGWLEGFPLGAERGAVRWLALEGSEPEEVRLGRPELSRGTHGLQRLLGEFPRALPLLVGDVPRWERRVRELLGLVKGAVHEGRALPAHLLEAPGAFPAETVRLGRALLGERPGLLPLLAAASFALLTRPEELRRVLRACGGRGAALERVLAGAAGPAGVALAWQLLRLDELDGARRCAVLLELLADPRIDAVPTAGSEGHVEALRKQVPGAPGKARKPLHLPARAEPRLGAALRRLPAWLLEQPQGPRRRALRLLGLLSPAPVLGAWAAWWQEVDRAAQDLADLARRPPEAHAYQPDAVGGLHRRLDGLARTVPAPLSPERLCELVRAEATGASERRHELVCRALERLPPLHERVPLRPRFLEHWRGLDKAGSAPARRLEALLGAFADYVAEAPGPLEVWLRPYGKLLSREPRGGEVIDADLLGDGDGPRALPHFFDALRRAARAAPAGLDGDQAELLLILCAATGDAARACALWLTIREEDCSFCARRLAPLAVTLSEGEAERFPAVFGALLRLAEDRGWGTLVTDLEPVTKKFQEAGLLATLRAALLGAEAELLLDAGRWLRVLRAGRCPAPAAGGGAAPPWAGRYPAALHGLLARWHSLDGDAEGGAARLLGALWPDPAALKTELAAIERKAETASEEQRARLLRRAENLRARLEPAPPSAERVRGVTEKLERAVEHAVLRAWQGRLRAELRAQAQQLLGAHLPEPWLADAAHLRVLAAVIKLEGAPRALGQEVLRVHAARCADEGAPSVREWLLALPANRRFLERLAAQGVDPAPWADGIGARAVRGAGGQELTLRLEDDPLAIFRMGDHFGTCLSPGQCNFFAVVGNIVDVNKRVLYARDARGTVQARCLLCLTDGGAILAFHPYAHDGDLGFEAMVRGFVEELAARMGAGVVPRGAVSCLVSPRWYDDGPVDLTGSFTALEEGSPLRQRLQTVPPGELPEVLAGAFSPLPLNAHTLSLALELPEVLARAELAPAMVALAARHGDLPGAMAARLALWAFRAGHEELGRRALGERVIDHALRVARELCCWDCLEPGLAEVLLLLDASELLRFLRLTRPRDVRELSEERHPGRLWFAGRALEALHRPRQALDAYRRALRVGAQKEIAAACKQRVEALAPRRSA